MRTNPSRLWTLGLVSLAFCAAIETAKGADPTPTARPSVNVLVAYYSLTGNTEQMAGGVVEGIKRVAGATVKLKKVDEVTKQDLESADAIVLGCPTYYGNVPGRMKVVIDDWSWKMKVDFTDKVGAVNWTAHGGWVSGWLRSPARSRGRIGRLTACAVSTTSLFEKLDFQFKVVDDVPPA